MSSVFPLFFYSFVQFFSTEVRHHGVGYYQFSKVEEERHKQMETLNKLREEVTHINAFFYWDYFDIGHALQLYCHAIFSNFDIDCNIFRHHLDFRPKVSHREDQGQTQSSVRSTTC